MSNWGWWKARGGHNGVGYHSITVDTRNQFGFDWWSALSVPNQLVGWNLFIPATWVGVPDAQADVVFSQSGPICPHGDWNGSTCTERRHMWVQTLPGWQGQFFVTRCIVHWDGNYWAPWDPGWQAYYWHWQVVMHEVMHCLGYPDVIPPTDYVGVFSYYRFWDVGYRSANWFGADDREMLVRDGYGI